MLQMAMCARAANAPLQQQAGELRYVARQPILNLRGKAHGYELLFWNGREPNFGADSNLATRTMLDNTVVFGLEELTRGLPAFVNCTADSLTEEWVQVLPPNMTVLELSLERGSHAGVAGGLRQAQGIGLSRGAGQLPEAESRPLADLADYVKVDIAKVGAAERRNMLQPDGRHSGSPGGAECGDAGTIRAGLQGRLRAFSGLLFLPSRGIGEPQDSRQPAGASGDSGRSAKRSHRPATPERVGDVRCLADLSAAAPGQLAHLRHAPGDHLPSIRR
jgi:hypothetical protein